MARLALPWRPASVIAVVLIIPILPFALVGWWLEPALAKSVQQLQSPVAIAAAVVLTLASDIFLPVPSSVVGTVAGGRLGWFLGSLCTMLGLNIGATIGFALARRWGSEWIQRRLGTADTARTYGWRERVGSGLLVWTRPVPLVAEAAVLWCGVSRISWSSFLWGILPGNLVLGVAYAGLGAWSASRGQLVWGVVAAVLIPMGALFTFRNRNPRDSAPKAQRGPEEIHHA